MQESISFAVAHNYAGRSIPHHLDGRTSHDPSGGKHPMAKRSWSGYTDTLFGSAYMEAMNIGLGTGYEDVVASLPEYLNAVSQRITRTAKAATGSWARSMPSSPSARLPARHPSPSRDGRLR